MRPLRPLLSAALVALSLAACSPKNVIAGGLVASQALFLTADDERRIGERTRTDMLGKYREVSDPALQAYLQGLGERLVKQSGDATFSWEWHVVDSDEINAFAAPAGYVFVTTGALRLMTNEAQLAGVVGHEVAHVTKHHGLDGIRQAMIAQGVVVGAVGTDASQLAQLGAKFAATLVLKHRDRGQETEADALGMDYAYALGYDPRELGAFLGALSRVAGETPAWLGWLSDHPGSNDRTEALTAHIRERRMDLGKTRTGEAEFRAAVLDRLGAASPAAF